MTTTEVLSHLIPHLRESLDLTGFDAKIVLGIRAASPTILLLPAALR